MYETFCSSCHGPDGKGGAKASSIVDGTFLALLTDQELRTLVIVGRPDLGAPDWRNNVPGKPMTSAGNFRRRRLARRAASTISRTSLSNAGQTRGRTPMTLPENLSRRAMLIKLGIFFNGIVAAILRRSRSFATFFRRSRARAKPGYASWLALGRSNNSRR